MDILDGSYLLAISLAGAVARAFRRKLPPGWRMRLEAKPSEDLAEGWIWLHAVSVGELMLADPLVGCLRAEGHRIHVTTGTPAGLELLQKRIPGWDAGTGQVSGGAFPVDDPRGLAPFFRCKPGAFIALETELWPNLIRELERQDVPRCVVNGRLTARSLKRGGPWMRRAASRLTRVAARDEVSAAAFKALGAPDVRLGGNLKADLPPPPPLHAGWEPLRKAWASCPVLVVGNTVDGEEALLLGVWRQLRASHPDLRLLMAPRQPRRFQEVAELFQAEGLVFRRASGDWPGSPSAWEGTEALLIDTLGELSAAYALGSVVLVGGGWNWKGGHNPLEPVRWGIPTLIGPGFENFEDLVIPLREAGLVQVVEAGGLEALIPRILARSSADPLPTLPPSLQGALARTMAILKDLLPQPDNRWSNVKGRND